MNYHTLSGNQKAIKMLQNVSAGALQTKGDTPVIAVVDSTGNKTIVNNMVGGIRSKGGVAHVFGVPNYGYLNKINPLTSKYNQSISLQSATTMESIIKTNMVDGVVIVAECEVVASGLMMGALRANCPMLVCSVGFNPDFDTMVLKHGGMTVAGTTKTKLEDLCLTAKPLAGYPKDDVTHGFFSVLEKIGFAVENSNCPCYSGAQTDAAYRTGVSVVALAKDLISPKRNLTKESYALAVETTLTNGLSVDCLHYLKPLYKLCDVKTPHDLVESIGKKVGSTPPVVLCRGTACTNGGYVMVTDGMEQKFTGKAWVYHTIADADAALSQGTIPPNSIVVVFAPNQDIGSIVYTIHGLGMQKNIAVVTDGLCGVRGVMVVSGCTPNSYVGEDFANIQTGDALDINLATGRFNTSVPAKDMKARIKKNTPKKIQLYFQGV